MKKLLSSLLVLTFVFLGALVSFNTVFAQSTEVVSKLEPTDCFSPGLYKFQSVQVSVGPEKGSYNAGETINFVGNIINQNNYPVVDGNVFVRIGKQNPYYIHDGHNAVDEIMAVSNVSVDASSSLPVIFSWTVPKDLGVGDYRADYFFSVGKKFNLGGLPFTNEIIVGFSNFKINNIKETEFVLDRTTTKVNGIKYNHIGQWPAPKEGEKIEIVQPVKNFTDKEIKVSVNYDLYYWDSLDPADKLDSKVEMVTVPAKSSKNLTYTISKSEKSVYYLRIKATVGDASSMVNIRTTSNIEKARINYPAITAFPLTKGDSANLFSCFHTVYGVASSSKLVLSLTDKNGNSVAKGEYTGSFGSNMNGAVANFTAGKDYTFLNLKAELFDNGKLTDSYQIDYDCSSLKSAKCELLTGNTVNKTVIFWAIILILVSLLGLSLVTRFVKEFTWRKIFVGLFILVAILSLVTLAWVIVVGIDKVGAETVSVDGKTKSETSSGHVTVYRCYGLNSGEAVTGNNIDISYSATLVGPTTVSIGDSIKLTSSSSCQFFSDGGSYDSPYCGEGLTFDTDNYSGYIDFEQGPTSVSLTSSNTAVVTCSEKSCTAVGPGTTILTKSYGSTNVFLKKVESLGAQAIYPYRNMPRQYPASINGCADYKTVSSTTKPYSRPITLPGYSPTWNITVNPINGICGQTSNACVSGTFEDVSDTPGYSQWNCKGGTGGTDAACWVALPLSLSCEVYEKTNTGFIFPDNLIAPAKVTWIAKAFGGANYGYKYSWDFYNSSNPKGSWDIVNSDIVSNDRVYNIPQKEYAFLKVKDASNATVSIDCPEITITSDIVTPLSPPTTEPIISPPGSPTQSTTYTCDIISPATDGKLNVNTNTLWTATITPPCPDCTYAWRVKDYNNSDPEFISATKDWDNIFTTLGLKTVEVQILIPTGGQGPNQSCSPTPSKDVTIVQSGAGVIEI